MVTVKKEVHQDADAAHEERLKQIAKDIQEADPERAVFLVRRLINLVCQAEQERIREEDGVIPLPDHNVAVLMFRGTGVHMEAFEGEDDLDHLKAMIEVWKEAYEQRKARESCGQMPLPFGTPENAQA